MRTTLTGGLAVLTLTAGTAAAGGLDRSGTPTGIIFEDGNYAEFSYGYAMPDLTGEDVLGSSIDNVGDDFGVAGFGVKVDLNEQFSIAFIYDQPYGADVEYGLETVVLGGTFADADSDGFTLLGRYKFNDNFSVYAGPRYVTAGGAIGLSGAAYGPVSGYVSDFDDDGGWGYVAGAAYEIPDIALRVSATYHSSIDLTFDTDETIPPTLGGTGTPGFGGTTDTELPQSFELAAQSGIAADTLLFGSWRWSEWSAFTLVPPGVDTPFGNLPGNLADLENVHTFELGVGRRFTDKFAGSVSVTYEPSDSDDLVSPLSPSNGLTALNIGGQYEINDQVTLSGGVSYAWLGDAMPETGTPDVARGDFENNDVLSFGFKIGFSF